jgi:F-type H+-transporting ATPase subunit b
LIDLNATLIAQIINFFILLFLLTKLAWKPLLAAMAERQARITNNLESAERDRLAAEQMKADYQNQMQQAKNDAQAIVDKAMKLAEDTKTEIIASAREEHARLLAAAQEQIARERQQALEDIRSEVVVLSLAAATKLIGQSVDESVNAKLVDEFIRKLDDQKQGGLPC